MFIVTVYYTVSILCYSLAWLINSVLFLKINLDNVTFSFSGKPKRFKRRFYLSLFSITKAHKKLPEIPFSDIALLNVLGEKVKRVITCTTLGS